MKKRMFLGFLGLLFISCSGKNDIIILDHFQTLKARIQEKDKGAFWCEELEGNILSKDISVSALFFNYVNTDIILLSGIQSLKKPLYPELEGIGSLDTTSMDSLVYSLVKTACNQIVKNPKKNLDTFFDENYFFNYIFFINDLQDGWKNQTGKNFPLDHVFTSYDIGQALDSFDFIQIPVRFYTSKFFVDLNIFVSNNEKNVTIKQIEIEQWGNLYGTE